MRTFLLCDEKDNHWVFIDKIGEFDKTGEYATHTGVRKAVVKRLRRKNWKNGILWIWEMESIPDCDDVFELKLTVKTIAKLVPVGHQVSF